MKAKKPKKALIHKRPLGQMMAWYTACGKLITPTRDNGVQISSVIREVTCIPCLDAR